MSSFFLDGVRAALPIGAAYVPVALALGAASSQLGFGPLQSAFWSFAMFSGANQALLLSSLAAGAPLFFVALLCAAASLRHILYGLVLADRVPPNRSVRLLFGYGLTDEVFAAVIGESGGTGRKLSGAWLIGLAATVLAVWVVGTGIGNLIGDVLRAASPKAQHALDFALPSLFVALLWSAANRSVLFRMVIAAGLAASVAGLGFPALAIPAGAIAAFIPAFRK